METFRIPQHPLNLQQPFFMNPISTNITRVRFSLHSVISRCFCTSFPQLTTTQDPISSHKSGLKKFRAKVSDVELKEKWLDSLSCPYSTSNCEKFGDVRPSNVGSQWVIGIDPDVSGALALLKSDDSGCSAQVFDSPNLKVLIGKRTRRRLDTKAIVQLLQSLDAPIGTTAYIEQSLPYPQDGKQGWWSGGFNYGLWIGVLVASKFSVIPVPSNRWKNEFKLSGNGSTKDDSREVASTLFPSISSSLTRKKDHGRAEALLIAAYGKSLKLNSDSACISEGLIPHETE